MRQNIIRRLQAEDLREQQNPPFSVIAGQFSPHEAHSYSAGDYRRYLYYEGRKRFYDLHIPAGYSKEKKSPLVLVFHGGGGNPLHMRYSAQMDGVSDANDFIVLYPAGTGRLMTRFLTYNAGDCCGYAKKNQIDDVGFTRVLLEDLATLFYIDEKRIFATGFSNGAFFSYRLAYELSNRVAAIAPVSGVMGINPPTTSSRDTFSRPVPIIHFHGREDQNSLYHGGIGPRAREKVYRQSVQETLAFWLKHNGLPIEPTETLRFGKAVRRRYGLDKDGVEIIFWTLEDGGHTWPGGKTLLPESRVGKLSRDIFASELMWKFFERHPLS